MAVYGGRKGAAAQSCQIARTGLLFGLFEWKLLQDSMDLYCIMTINHLLLSADTIQVSRGCRESSQNWISVFQVRVQETIRESIGVYLISNIAVYNRLNHSMLPSATKKDQRYE